MLLCIEMAIFAVMHLFAFPWREYDLSKTPYADPITAPGSGFSGTAPRYHGGWMGLRAYADTFNPWDLIKATARGFRWLFVRRKHRHHDISYTTPKLGIIADEPATSIPGPNVTSNTLPSATELNQQRRARADTVEDGDTAGLLSNVQQNGLSAHPYPYSPSHSPIRGESLDDRSDQGEAEAPDADMSLMGGARVQPQPGSFGGSDPRLGLNRWDTDTEYHSATGPASMGPYAGIDGHAESSANQWDHWAGATRHS